MKKILHKNGYHSILRFDSEKEAYCGSIEEMGDDEAYRFQGKNIEKAMYEFECIVDRIDDDKAKKQYISSVFETKKHHSFSVYCAIYGILWIAVSAIFQLVLKIIFHEEETYFAATFILGGLIMWSVINIYSSRYFYELFCNLRRPAVAVAFHSGCPALVNGWSVYDSFVQITTV